MGTNMYPSASLLGQDKDASIASLPVEELIEKADGFAGVFPGSHSLPVHPDDFLFHILFFSRMLYIVLTTPYSFPQSTSMKLSRSCKIGSTSVE